MSIVYRFMYFGMPDNKDDHREASPGPIMHKDTAWHRAKYVGAFTHVELRINGHWHRPPVGIKAEQATHVLAVDIEKGSPTYGREVLVPR